MTADARGFWYPFCGSYKDFILKITNPDKIYYDTNFTRFYMDMKDKKRVDEIVLRLKKYGINATFLLLKGNLADWELEMIYLIMPVQLNVLSLHQKTHLRNMIKF